MYCLNIRNYKRRSVEPKSRLDPSTTSNGRLPSEREGFVRVPDYQSQGTPFVRDREMLRTSSDNAVEYKGSDFVQSARRNRPLCGVAVLSDVASIAVDKEARPRGPVPEALITTVHYHGAHPWPRTSCRRTRMGRDKRPWLAHSCPSGVVASFQLRKFSRARIKRRGKDGQGSLWQSRFRQRANEDFFLGVDFISLAMGSGVPRNESWGLFGERFLAAPPR